MAALGVGPALDPVAGAAYVVQLGVAGARDDDAALVVVQELKKFVTGDKDIGPSLCMSINKILIEYSVPFPCLTCSTQSGSSPHDPARWKGRAQRGPHSTLPSPAHSQEESHPSKKCPTGREALRWKQPP